MDLKELKEVRLKELDNKYKPIIKAYNDQLIFLKLLIVFLNLKITLLKYLLKNNF
ncbi:hypothetical protein [Clostridium perfringens]|uniref:hypothetical protein n=1 Tax=Clostridium perfringens TaxID=1502 RepID=UPI0023659CB2|nr:hypothetical protein [Clostridium perfringens]